MRNIKQYQTLAELLADFEALQEIPLLAFDDVVEWFRYNINQACSLRSGQPRVVIGSTLSYDYSVKKGEDGSVVLYSTVDWLRGSDKAAFASLKQLESNFSSIGLFALSPVDFRLSVTFEFDLTQWANLVPASLSNTLYTACVDESISTEQKSAARDSITILLEKFYPDIPISILYAAADMGMVESDERIFMQWFDAHLKTKTTMSLDLPNNLE